MRRYGPIQVERLPNRLIRTFDLRSTTAALFTEDGTVRSGNPDGDDRLALAHFLAGQPSNFRLIR